MTEQFLTWVQANPMVLTVAAGIVLLVLLVKHARANFTPQIDPVRLFTVEQKTQAMARCGSRCEAESFPFNRCNARAAQGDHWYPHSKGGTTNPANLAMLCPTHNRAKSDHIPTAGQTTRLDWRRRRYAPGLGRPGERYH